MKRKIMILFVALLFATSIYANDEKEIKHALLKYNYGIIKMAKSGETDFFKSFVKEDVVTKLMLWVKSWQDNNLVMLAQIDDFNFSPIVYNDKNATMKTTEKWTFSYIDISTRTVALEPVGMYYEMSYTLQKINNSWMIVDIKHLKEEKIEKDETYKALLEPLKKSLEEDTYLDNNVSQNSSSKNSQGKIATH